MRDATAEDDDFFIHKSSLYHLFDGEGNHAIAIIADGATYIHCERVWRLD